jgi:hypothetical protein
MTRVVYALVMIVAFAASAAHAADPRYPDWPCVQAKVPDLSPAALWAGPPLDEPAKAWANDPAIKDLVPRLAARRVPIEDAQKLIADVMTGSAAERETKGKLLFAGVFERLNAERGEVMRGIERLARRQKDMADKIRESVIELHRIQDLPAPEPAKLEELSRQVEWSTRIFEDRRKTVRFVCVVPVLLEQRLGALARAIQQGME